MSSGILRAYVYFWKKQEKGKMDAIITADCHYSCLGVKCGLRKDKNNERE